jgi:hypothetical protein
MLKPLDSILNEPNLLIRQVFFVGLQTFHQRDKGRYLESGAGRR